MQDVVLIDFAANAGNVSAAERAVIDQLSLVNEELERYTCKANMFDYALAAASGAMAGAIDSLYVGDAGLSWLEDVSPAHALFSGVAVKTDKTTATGNVRFDPHSASLNELLRKVLEFVEKQGLISDANKKVNQQLERMARQPAPQGLAASIVIQILRITTQVNVVANRDGQPMDAYLEQVKELLIPATIVGFLNWLKAVSKQRAKLQEPGEVDDGSKSRALIELAFAAAQSKVFADLVEAANGWLDKRMKETLQLSRKPKKGYDVSAVLLSLLRHAANMPNVNGNGCLAAVGKSEQILGSSRNPYALGSLTKQAIPVLLNEVIVRMGFFVTRLVGVFVNTNSSQELDWVAMIPVGNRTVDRMMTIASMTLTAVDTTDAANRASVEAAAAATEVAAYGIIYAQRFVARYNYVAAGRAVISVVREMSDEVREARLIHEKRLLSEARAVLTVERLEEYKAQLAERLDDYLVEHLTAFTEGLSLIDQGLADGDSDLVISGNVTIQRALGREVQFTNQDEFDALMETDDDFVF